MRWKICLATLAASWGFISIIVAKIGLDASVLVFYRLSLAVLAVGAGLLIVRRTDLLRLPTGRATVVALGVILAAHWFLYFETIKISSVVVAVLTVALAPFLALAPRVLLRGPAATAGVLCVGIVFTGLSGLLYIALLGKVTAQAAGILAFLEPVSASLLAWAQLGEHLSIAVALGGILVLAAGTLVVFYEPGDAAAVEVPGLGSAQ